MFENRVLRDIYGPIRKEVTGSGEDYNSRGFIILTPHKILFG